MERPLRRTIPRPVSGHFVGARFVISRLPRVAHDPGSR